MSATMERHGSRVQFTQSDMYHALNVSQMSKGWFSRAAIDETQYRIKKPRAEVRHDKKWGVDFPAHEKVYAEMERHQAMIR
jgi:hypothetical protein